MDNDTRFPHFRRNDGDTVYTRRRFLHLGSSAALAAVLVPSVLSCSTAADCEPTTPDIEGPYYKAGSPHRAQIAAPTEQGRRLFVRGTAHAADCETPLPDVLLDIWQADSEGVYDTSDTYKLRGKVQTDAAGAYSFETILPGKYQGRPRHIHLMLTAPGQATVTTQLYFAGDSDIPGDPWASQPAAANRIIALTEDDNGALHGVFDLVMNSTTEYGEGRPLIRRAGLLAGNHPNPFSEITHIHGELAAPALVELAIVDINGRPIRLLERRRMEPGAFTVHWDARSQSAVRVPPGTYVCRMSVNGTPVDYLKLVRF